MGYKLITYNLKPLLSVLLLLLTMHVHAYSKIMTLCREDGIFYYQQDDPTSTEFANGWKWTFKGGDIATSNLKTTPTVTYHTAGTFVTYIETYFPTLPTKYDSMLVIVNDWPIPPFYFPKDTGYCAGSSIFMTLNASTFPNITYQWSTGETTKSINITSKGKYWVKMVIKSDAGACDSVYKEVNVTEYVTPTVDLGKDQLMCQSQLITLDAKGGGAGDTYFWTPGNQTTKTIVVNLPGVYSVLVTTPDKCTATDQVELIDSCPHLIFMPNAVSPNADLLNDVYDKIWNFTPKEYTFSIYNRWGELLFETHDMTKAWDCKVKDQTVQQDIYVYKLDFLDTDKKWYTYRGTFFVDR